MSNESDRPKQGETYNITATVEALIFASGTSISRSKISELLNVESSEVASAVRAIKERYAAEEFGMELVEVNGGVQFRTKVIYSDFVRELKRELPRRLTTAALETLAVIAYRQPIVKSDIERIRGVDVTPTIKTLLERDIIKIIGHQPSVGLPALYGTTDEFLKIFGLDSLSALPTLRDVTELDADPGEVEEVIADAANS